MSFHQHPTITEVVRKFKALELHAARAGREVFEALVQAILDSQAQTVYVLAGEMDHHIETLLIAMPAYAPPLNAICRVSAVMETCMNNGVSVQETKAILSEEREHFRQWSNEARERISNLGATLIHPGNTIFTFTYGETVMGVFRQAASQRKPFRIKLTESRPNNDGLITASALSELGVSVELSIDACMVEMISGCDLMMVGAESISAEGSAICKVGTYPAALIAREYGIPVYIVVDTSKFYRLSLNGSSLVLNSLQRNDVIPGNSYSGAKVMGHLFDETPQVLITALVTERGIIPSITSAVVMQDISLSSRLLKKLTAWSIQKNN